MPNTEPEIDNSTNLVHVAVGVVINHYRQVLVAYRHKDQHQGGLWEFPGGKVEPGESVQQALRRELDEEVNIRVEMLGHIMDIHHDYGDKKVYLDVWYVVGFTGDVKGKEGQEIKWVDQDELESLDFPEANLPILDEVKKLLNSQR